MKHITTIAAALLAVFPVVGMAKPPSAKEYADAIRGKIANSANLIEATKTQLADCRSTMKNNAFLSTDYLLRLMQRANLHETTSSEYRAVSHYQDRVVSSLHRAMQACAAPADTAVVTSMGSEACSGVCGSENRVSIGGPNIDQPPAFIYAHYTRGQIESATTLIEATSTQLADCRSPQKDHHMEQARLMIGSMQRTQENAGDTEAGFRKVSLYQDAVVSNLGHAMQACEVLDGWTSGANSIASNSGVSFGPIPATAAREPSTPPFAYLIRDRIKVTAALVDAAALCSEDRNLSNARRHLDRMRRIADGEATAKALTEVSTEQNHVVAFVAQVLKVCK